MTDIEQTHIYQDLINLFNHCFDKEFNTRLVKGADEPIYLPASESCNYHQLIFAHGYYASALHEVAHWCIAGRKRRLLEDFGYWYEADGRNAEEQKVFEQVEKKPQAVEWAFCAAANKKFNVSADNLNGFQGDANAFKRSVYAQILLYIDKGFPPQAQLFIKSLTEFYHVAFPLTVEHFNFEDS